MISFRLEMERFQRNLDRNKIFLQKSKLRSSYTGLPLGVNVQRSKPSIKPASNIAAYDNRRGTSYLR